MRRLSIKSIISVVRKLFKKDIIDDRMWAIYHHPDDSGRLDSPQPKGFPKRFKTKEEAEHFLKIMQKFKHMK